MKVYVHLATGFEEIEALTVVDLLRRVEIPVETVSVTGEYMVTGTHGVPVKADLLFEEADYNNCDMIVLPGGMPGTNNLGAHEALMEKVKAFAAEDKWLAAICAAPMLLGQAGLLKGRTAVVYPGLESHLKDAKVGQNIVEVDGKFITSKGPGTALAFALAIIEVLKDKQTVDALKKKLLLHLL